MCMPVCQYVASQLDAMYRGGCCDYSADNIGCVCTLQATTLVAVCQSALC